MAGCSATLVIGALINYFDCAKNPLMLGRILAAVCSVAYIGAIISWQLAGKAFKRKQE